MKRAVPWLTAISILGCLALWQRSQISKETLAQDTAEKKAQSKISDLKAEISTLKEEKEQADRQIAQMTQASSAAQKSQGNGDNAGGAVIHLSEIFKDHPEYLALYEKQMRRNVDRMYGNGLETLGLAPDQLAKLKNLLVERQMGALDAQQAAQAAGLEQGSPAWQTAMQQASQDVQNQITSLLGDNADATLAQLRARVYIQNQVQNSFAPDFSDAGVPLTPDQTNGLIQAMADANYAGKDTSTRPANYNDADATTWLSPHDDRIINNATPVLNPQQVQLLAKDEAENEQMAAIMKTYNNAGKPVMIVP
jgi:hypothetical protein